MLLEIIKNNEPMLFSSDSIYIPSEKQTLDQYLKTITSQSHQEELKEQENLALLIQTEKENTEKKYNRLIQALGQQSANFPYWAVYQWSDIPESLISTVLTAHYNGIVNLADYWQVGDERIYTLTDAGNYSNTPPVVRYAHCVILDFNKDDLITSIGNRNKAAITIGYYISDTIDGPPIVISTNIKRTVTTNALPATYTGDWTPYANTNFCYLAMFDRFYNFDYNNNPTTSKFIDDFTLYNLIKEVSKKTANQSSSIVTTEDLVFPPSFSEMAGDHLQITGEENVYAFFTGANELSQKKLKQIFVNIDETTYKEINDSTWAFIKMGQYYHYSGFCPISIRSNPTNHNLTREMQGVRDIKYNNSYYITGYPELMTVSYYYSTYYFANKGLFNFICFNI